MNTRMAMLILAMLAALCGGVVTAQHSRYFEAQGPYLEKAGTWTVYIEAEGSNVDKIGSWSVHNTSVAHQGSSVRSNTRGDRAIFPLGGVSSEATLALLLVRREDAGMARVSVGGETIATLSLYSQEESSMYLYIGTVPPDASSLEVEVLGEKFWEEATDVYVYVDALKVDLPRAPVLTHRNYLPILRRDPFIPTPTVPPTLTPMPTRPPASVRVLDNHTYYEYTFNSQKYVHVNGEIVNQSPYPVRGIVWVRLYDETGKQRGLIVSGFPDDASHVIPSGMRVCFGGRTWFYPSESDWELGSYEIVPSFYTDPSAPDVFQPAIFNDDSFYDAERDSYVIVGQIRNNHYSRVRMFPVITLYNADGKIADCGWTEPIEAEAGEVADFDLEFLWGDYSAVTRYEIDGMMVIRY